MSNTLFLDALKKYELQQYYPSLYSHGMSTLNSLAELSMQDCTKVGVRSIDDKRKFMALADDLKQQMRAKSSKPSTIATTPSPQQSRKRTFKAEKTPPEKHARRMTLAQQTLPRTSTSPKAPSTARTSTVAPRRLSYLPRPPALSSNRSPIRNGRTTSATYTTTVSPSRVNHSKTPPKLPNFLEETGVEVKFEGDPPQIQKQGRLLNAYGIPVAPSKRRLSTEVPGPLISFEEYIESRSPAKSQQQQQQQQQHSTVTTTATSSDLNQRIRVCVRKRPLSKKEKIHGDTDVAPVVGARTIQINAPKTRVDLTPYTEQHSFTFDDVFDSDVDNLHIYSRTALPLVDYMFSGGKATCFAYGQTGSGKTYTMLDPQHGLYVQAGYDIFNMLGQPQYAHLSAWVGFYEIYQGHLYDLLNQRKKLVPRDDGNSNVVIAGLKEFQIKDVDRLMDVFDFGSQARTTGQTGANNNSSRSHAVLQVLLKKKKDNSMHGKLSFIDLAGSERGADRGEANSKTRKEGAEINKSLLALKECIRALDQNQRHTSFRGSKLTQVLRDSFVGNSQTCMIATISPNNPNSEHTLNTLRYADRVKELKGESDPRLLAEKQQETIGLATAKSDNSTYMDGLEFNEHRDELASTANSDAMLDEHQAENLLDIDFPSQMSNNALATPQAHHHAVDEDDDADSPQRQQQYLRRNSSPSEELFSTPIEDPFHSTPRTPNPASSATTAASSSNSGLISMPKAPSMPSDSPQISVKHIRDFIKLHRAQLKELEECMKLEKKMISKLSLNISSHHDFNDDDEQDADEHAKTVQLYEDYLNDLDDVHERKVACVETFGERIKAELGEEEDEDMEQ